VNERAQDLKTKSSALKAALNGADAAKLFHLACAAEVATAFRDTDAMIGLTPVDPDLVEEVSALIDQALQRAAEAGLVDARRHLGDRLIDGGRMEEAVTALAPLAAAGDPGATARAAEIVWRLDLDDHVVVARSWLAAATPNDADGKVTYLRALYAYHGLGQTADLSESQKLHEAAAAKGYADSMFELYIFHAKGLAGTADAAAAHAWLERAAEAGNNRAMSNQGGAYATGTPLVEQDLAKSAHWYDRAAVAVNGRAAATLGIMYAMGNDLPKDDEKARHYFDLSDEIGFDWRSLAERVGVDPEAYE